MTDIIRGYRHNENGPVGLALTGEAYAMAHGAGIDEIKPDVDAMAEIAECVGAEMRDGKLPPLLLVARATPAGPNLRRDTQLPEHQGQTGSAMYHFAQNIDSESALSTNRDQLVRAAKIFGATALTEISIVDWRQSTQDHVRAFAAGLVLHDDARKPLDLPPAPSPFESTVGFFMKGLRGGNSQLAKLNRVRQNPNLPSPFIFKNRTGTVIDLAAR